MFLVGGLSGDSVRLFLTINAATVTLFVSLVSWAYQIGSKRLGVVDLFGCEIATIGRVYAVVGIAQRLINSFDAGRRPGDASGGPRAGEPAAEMQSRRTPMTDAANMANFKINQSYTPVIDNNVGDLENLDAEVVTNVTEFYTYRRAMVDYLFQWGQAGAAPGPDIAAERRQQYFLKQAIYMLFLSLESARHALDDLVEYEPNHAEARINILLEELPAYAFLLDVTECREEDVPRYNRLVLRLKEYKRIYESSYGDAVGSHPGDEKAWERAKTTARDLKDCYDVVAASPQVRRARIGVASGG